MLRFAALLALVAFPTVAQSCAPVKEALNNLQANYGEGVRVAALMGSGEMLMITAAPNGTWTAITVAPDGTACIVATGEAFEVHDAAPMGEML